MTTGIIERLFAEVDAEWPGVIPPMDHLQIAYATSIVQKAFAITSGGGELDELVVKLTEHAVMELDADEENTLQIEAWAAAAEKEIRAFLAALTAKPSTEGDAANDIAVLQKDGVALAEQVWALVEQCCEHPFRSIEWLGDQLLNLPTAKLSSEALVEALKAISSQAICYGMRADEAELRDWLKFISETAEAALAGRGERP